MPEKKKLKLEDLKVESLVTALESPEALAAQGGQDTVVGTTLWLFCWACRSLYCKTDKAECTPDNVIGPNDEILVPH